MQGARALNTPKLHLEFIGESIKRFNRDNGLVLAGNMAFLGMLGLYPFLIFLVAVSGLFGQTEAGQEAIALFLSNLPKEVADVIDGPIAGIVNHATKSVLTISILFSLWTAASSVEAARAAITRAYGREYQAAFWRRRLESLFIVILSAVLVIVTMAIIFTGPAVIQLLTDYIAIPNWINNIIALARYGLGPLVLFVAIWLSYFALSPRTHFDKVIYAPGAIATVLIWLGTAAGFSTYLRYAGNWDLAYGSLAGVLIAQIFFFVVSIGYIFGAQLNACWTRHYHGQITESDEGLVPTENNAHTRAQ